MTDRVLVRVDSHVARVTLNRPDKRNGLDLEMFDALIAAGEQVRATRGVRAVVLHGEGKAFCAGLDWQAFLSSPDALRRLLTRDAEKPGNLAHRIAWQWQELQVPVIAAVHGAAVGGGLQLALGADVRVVAPDAKLCVMEARYGLIPDMGASVTLRRVVREDVARELTFTARTVDGTEAVALGLATHVDPDPLARATAIAQQIARHSPHATRAAKKLFVETRELGVRAALEKETELQLGLLGTPAQMESAMAVMQKREPSFEDP